MRKPALLKSKRGLTLTEVVVGIAILSLLFLFIVTVFPTAISIVGDQAQLKRSDKGAAAGLENQLAGQEAEPGRSVIDDSPGRLEIDFPAGKLQPDGVFLRSQSADGGTVFYYFKAD